MDFGSFSWPFLRSLKAFAKKEKAETQSDLWEKPETGHLERTSEQPALPTLAPAQRTSAEKYLDPPKTSP